MYMGDYCFYLYFLFFILILSLLGMFTSPPVINSINFNKNNNNRLSVLDNYTNSTSLQCSKERSCPMSY